MTNDGQPLFLLTVLDLRFLIGGCPFRRILMNKELKEIIEVTDKIKSLNVALGIKKKQLVIDAGIRVKEIRNNQKLTQKSFADSIGVSRTTLTNIETGHQILTTEHLVLICLRYNISSDYILGFEKSETS